MPETFSSDLGDHPRSPQDSFNSEFHGASDSLIRRDRPQLIGGRGRTGIFLVLLVLVGPVLGFAGFALWYWRVPIGNWLAGVERPTQAAEPEAEEVAVPDDLPGGVPAGPPPVFGIRGAPDDGGGPLPEPEPAQPDTPTQPNTPTQPQPTGPGPAGKIESVSTDVRGPISSSTIYANLDKVDAAIPDCWVKSGAKGSVELVLSFGIQSNGSQHAISVRGGNDALQNCIRAALPTGGWPQPRDGGDATVTRTWKLAP